MPAPEPSRPIPTLESVMQTVEERGLRHATIGCFDWNGRFRSKRQHVRNLRKAMTEGTAVTSAIFAPDTAEQPITTGRFHAPANGYRDAVLRVRPETCRDWPVAEAGTGIVLIGELVDRHAAFCPRALLGAEIGRLAALGYEACGAFELECHLLRETDATIAHKVPADVATAPELARMCSFVDQSAAGALFAALEDTSARMDIAIDTLHAEFRGLLEIALAPRTGAAIADNAALFKSVSKVVARRFGLMACYMARLSSRHESAGGHLNLSLCAAGGAPAFWAPGAADAPAEVLRHFLGGLQRYTPELMLLHCPHVNSYKRFLGDSLAPKTNTWAIDNKTAAYRVVHVDPGSARIEMRLPGADVNPYLSLAGCLAAGRRGIEQRLEPTPPATGNAWEQPGDAGPALPAGFAEAIGCFERSAFAREVLGDEFVAAYAHSRAWQLAQMQGTVTDWELRTYAECV